METFHECASTEQAGWWLLAECPEDGSGSIVGIVVGIIILAAVGVGVWWLLKRRHG